MEEIYEHTLCLIYEVKKIQSYKRKFKKDEPDLYKQLTIEEWAKINSTDTKGKIEEYQRTKDKKILEMVINENYKLIGYTISKYELYKDRNIDLEDIEQQGYLGLICAINNFDASKNVMFSTYAVVYIKSYILDYTKMNCSSNIGITIHGTNLLNKYKKDNSINVKNKKDLEMSFNILSKSPMLLDKQINNDDGSSSLSEVISDKDSNGGFEDIDFKMVWKSIAVDLSSKERKYITYYLQGYKWVEMGEMFNDSPQSIRIYAMRALKKIKNKYSENELRDLLCS